MVELGVDLRADKLEWAGTLRLGSAVLSGGGEWAKRRANKKRRCRRQFESNGEGERVRGGERERGVFV